MILVSEIKRAIKLLRNPEKGLDEFNSLSFEGVVSWYVKMLIFLALATGLFTFLFLLVKAVYLDLFLTADIQYWRMINYSMGRTTSLIFFFLFAGTFILFFISILLRSFFRRLRYTKLLGLAFCSLTPVLLFGWIPVSLFPLFIWSLFLFIVGLGRWAGSAHIETGSIKQRN
ncbi:hypothetical protein JXC34_04580 [Candidatus Woesearchaeota archaeon]|nr:hypothetical protein [Candidatus Woesearchaeota archaeon]